MDLLLQQHRHITPADVREVFRRADSWLLDIIRKYDATRPPPHLAPRRIGGGHGGTAAVPGGLLRANVPNDDSTPGEVELGTGDFLEHPRLGLCEVVDLADESRIAIRIPTGRVVELHRRIVHLAFAEERDGHKVFSVSIRRKG